MKHFVDHIEIWLSIAGLGVIVAVPAVLGDRVEFWRATALTAVWVGLLHGLIFWVVRRRRMTARSEAIREIRAMLQDRVNNRLQVIVGSATAPDAEDRILEVHWNVGQIAELLRTLDEGSLREWRERYRGTVATEGPPRP